MINRYEVLVLAMLMAGCATSADVRIPAQYADRSQAFREGYAEGCTSAKTKSSQSKNMERIRADSPYANGWYDGFGECKSNAQPTSLDSVKR